MKNRPFFLYLFPCIRAFRTSLRLKFLGLNLVLLSLITSHLIAFKTALLAENRQWENHIICDVYFNRLSGNRSEKPFQEQPARLSPNPAGSHLRVVRINAPTPANVIKVLKTA